MPACPEDRTGDEQALDDLPVALAVALRLHRAGADRRLIASRWGSSPAASSRWSRSPRRSCAACGGRRPPAEPSPALIASLVRWAEGCQTRYVNRPMQWPLTGRDDEVAFLISSLARGRAVVIAGSAGVGKTRLARAGLDAGAMTEWAVATRSGQGIPFGAVAHLLEDTDAETPFGLFRAASRQVTTRAAGRPVALGVDDAHLLDDARLPSC